MTDLVDEVAQAIYKEQVFGACRPVPYTGTTGIGARQRCNAREWVRAQAEAAIETVRAVERREWIRAQSEAKNDAAWGRTGG
jgi:hypothetical protein